MTKLEYWKIHVAAEIKLKVENLDFKTPKFSTLRTLMASAYDTKKSMDPKPYYMFQMHLDLHTYHLPPFFTLFQGVVVQKLIGTLTFCKSNHNY